MDLSGELINPVLTSDRITLRPFRPSDAGAVAESCKDPQILKYTLMSEGLTEDDALQWINRRNELQRQGLFAFAITVDQVDVCIGQMGISIDSAFRKAETFYWIDQSSRRRGIASEALTLVTEWAFADHDVVRVQLITDPENDASQFVAARAGYQREGTLRAWEPVGDAQPDVVMWSRLHTDPAPLR